MSTNYPGTLDTFTNPTGTTTQDGPTAAGHAGQHANLNDAMGTLQYTLGTTAGTAILKNFAAGNFPIRQNTGGTMLDTIVLGTITKFVPTGTTAVTTAGGALAPTVGTLADASGGTIIANAAAGQIFEITLGTNATNRTIGTPNNPTDGQAISYRIKQNSASVGTLIWATVFRFAGGTAGTSVLGTTASSWNYYGFRYSSGDVKWDLQGESKNIV